MKNFLSVMIIAFVVAFSANCSAASVTDLKYITGNWYDTKGNLVLTISNDYKINGCVVMALEYNPTGIYKIILNEGNRYSDIELSYGGMDYHKTLLLNWKSNNPIPLRRTKKPRYFESIGGIYLGMDKDDVIKLYGQPLSIENLNRRFTTWKYREGFDVKFEFGVVYSITIYKNSDRRFDRSGLSANDSLQAFKNKYNVTPYNMMYTIGYGEGFWFKKDYLAFEVCN